MVVLLVVSAAEEAFPDLVTEVASVVGDVEDLCLGDEVVTVADMVDMMMVMVETTVTEGGTEVEGADTVVAMERRQVAEVTLVVARDIMLAHHHHPDLVPLIMVALAMVHLRTQAIQALTQVDRHKGIPQTKVMHLLRKVMVVVHPAIMAVDQVGLLPVGTTALPLLLLVIAVVSHMEVALVLEQVQDMLLGQLLDWVILRG